MLKLILRRAALLPLVVVSATFITFIVGYLAPGDPILALMGNQRNPELYDRLREMYGLNLPWPEQYLHYLGGLLQGDLGLSYRFAQRPVWELIQGGIGISLSLGLAALTLSLVLGIPLGLFAALRRNSASERLLMGGMLALYAVPSFVLIPVLQWVNYQVYLAGGPSLPAAGWGRPEHWVLPVLVLSAANLGYIARLTRASMVEVMDEDFIRTARSKGLTSRRVWWVHGFRNALMPVVTLVGPSIAFLVTGAFVVETLFSIPGIGYLSIEAIGQRDYPVIQATTVILVVAVVVMNLLTDIVYLLLDPRIRAGG